MYFERHIFYLHICWPNAYVHQRTCFKKLCASSNNSFSAHWNCRGCNCVVAYLNITEICLLIQTCWSHLGRWSKVKTEFPQTSKPQKGYLHEWLNFITARQHNFTWQIRHRFFIKDIRNCIWLVGWRCVSNTGYS